MTWTLTSKLDMPMSIWRRATDLEILYINVGIIVYTVWNKKKHVLFRMYSRH